MEVYPASRKQELIAKREEKRVDRSENDRKARVERESQYRAEARNRMEIVNSHYFEAKSMSSLYEIINGWQDKNQCSLKSISIESCSGMFCCIALS